MDYRDIDLICYLEELGVPFDINSLKGRISIQKLVLIGQYAGIDIGNYNFTLYHRGPYSPRLADRYYSAKTSMDLGDESYKKYRLIKHYREILDKIRCIIKAPEDSNLEESEWLEIVATLIYTHDYYKDWNKAIEKTKLVKGKLLKKSTLKIELIVDMVQKTKAYS